MNAETLAAALGGRRAGNTWMACCPAHEDRTPSLSIKDADDGKLLVHCFAGCSQAAVIGALRARGLWDDPSQSGAMPRHVEHRPRGGANEDERRRTAAALRTWCATSDATHTLAETYLRSRHVTITPPRRLRFHPHLKHGSNSAWPAMVALVTRGADDKPLGIHRTYLARDGRGKAPIKPDKMMLGLCGGGAVRLGPMSVPLMIGEGIETCLAAMQATGHTAWSALSTSGLRGLELPAEVRDVIILADGDNSGEEAALAAAARWRAQSRRVRIARAVFA